MQSIPPLNPINSGAKVRRFSQGMTDWHIKVEVSFLVQDADQKTAMAIYKDNKYLHYTFLKDRRDQQHEAQTILMMHGLDRGSRDNLESRWSVAWSNSWVVA